MLTSDVSYSKITIPEDSLVYSSGIPLVTTTTTTDYPITFPSYGFSSPSVTITPCASEEDMERMKENFEFLNDKRQEHEEEMARLRKTNEQLLKDTEELCATIRVLEVEVTTLKDYTSYLENMIHCMEDRLNS